MSMIEKFKESRKALEIKMEQANKLADDAENEFLESIKSLVKDASDEDVQAFLDADDDDDIEEMDKMVVEALLEEERWPLI